MILKAADLLNRTIDSSYGNVRCVRVVADEKAHPWVKTLDLRRPLDAAPLLAPMRLRTWTPIVGNISILKYLDDARKFLERFWGQIHANFLIGDFHLSFVRMRAKDFDDDIPTCRVGEVGLESNHPLAKAILDCALIHGFGELKDEGFGCLEVVPERRG